ncbi:dynamin family protein [Brevibacterium album]|uniref:dynamin family protein n=1 Tax=Brevibacterium album TaxID=417948 RepID=UPI001FE21BE4|nr:dynamin family protein [Brevibacterium album]
MEPRAKRPAVRAEAGPALTELLRRVRGARLPLDTPDAGAGRALRRALASQIEDYLLPRLESPEAPLLVVLGGSTGAGKSTLLNSMLRRSVTEAGVLRPTTRVPVLVHHPEDAEHFQGLGAALAEAPGQADAPGSEEGDGTSSHIRMVADEVIPRGLAVLDSPDIDSVSEANREAARALLAAADLWLFVTTASRYADAVPWALLTEAEARGTTIALVLDRVPAEANREVRHHLTELLTEVGLGSSPLFTVPEVALEDGLLPESASFTLTSWVLNLGRSALARERVIARTLAGALAALPPEAERLAESAASQEEARARLAGAVDDSFAQASAELTAALTGGRVLRGEVLARWQDFVGTGQFFRGLEPTVARVRDRITAAVTGRRDTAGPLRQAMESAVAVLVREQAVAAVSAARMGWEEQPAGRTLLADCPDPAVPRVPADFDARVRAAVTGWADEVAVLVRDLGESARAKARILSFGVDGVACVLMLAALSPAARPGGGTTEVAAKLLATSFGEEASADLVATVRSRLLDGVQRLLAGCRAGFDQTLAAAEVPPRQAGALRSGAARLKEALR